MVGAGMNAEVSTSPAFKDPTDDTFIYVVLGCKYPQRDSALAFTPFLVNLFTKHWRQFGVGMHIALRQGLSPLPCGKTGTTLCSKRILIITYVL